MKKSNFKTVIIKYYKVFKKYREDTRLIFDLCLIIVTIFLIYVTYSIARIEVTLSKERLKNEVKENILLVENAINELNLINNIVIPKLREFTETINPQEGPSFHVPYLRIEQVQNSVIFNNQNITSQLDSISTEIKFINSDIDEIWNSIRVNDMKIKRERTGSIKERIEGISQAIDNLIKRINEYKKIEEEKLINLNKEYEESLQKN